jgi:hypothetical protein
VEIKDPVSGYLRTTNTNSEGAFRFTNVPFNPYHLSVTADGFAPFAQDVQVRSSVPATVEVALKIGTEATKVVVESGGDLLENDPTFHSDLDRNSFARLPLESPSSSVSSLVTLTTPGIAADSNGLFHGLGDHAENSFSVDGQPITDQQSKVFSNQIPSSSIQSLEVISGAPPAEFGDKTRPGRYHTARLCHRFVRVIWFCNRGFRPCLWRTEVGELCRGGRAEYGPFSRSPGILRNAFERQSGRCVRSY